MQTYQKAFIELAIECQALQFGAFTLKSGRVSPYFFNAGLFNSGKALAALGTFYAETLVNAEVEFNQLFGPAYKGIPLATTTACALTTQHNKDVLCTFNRKEVKSHGEGGHLIGAPLKGQVAIIDDVITAGTAIREVLTMIEQSEAEAKVIVVGVNRQERGQHKKSAIAELEESTGIPVLSIVSLDDIVTFLEENTPDTSLISKMKDYRQTYGA